MTGLTWPQRRRIHTSRTYGKLWPSCVIFVVYCKWYHIQGDVRSHERTQFPPLEYEWTNPGGFRCCSWRPSPPQAIYRRKAQTINAWQTGNCSVKNERFGSDVGKRGTAQKSWETEVSSLKCRTASDISFL